MRDLGKTLDYIERGMLRGLDRSNSNSKPTSSLLLKRPKPQIRAWRAPVTASSAKVVYPVE
jgi:hypothetical protein